MPLCGSYDKLRIMRTYFNPHSQSLTIYRLQYMEVSSASPNWWDFGTKSNIATLNQSITCTFSLHLPTFPENFLRRIVYLIIYKEKSLSWSPINYKVTQGCIVAFRSFDTLRWNQSVIIRMAFSNAPFVIRTFIRRYH